MVFSVDTTDAENTNFYKTPNHFQRFSKNVETPKNFANIFEHFPMNFQRFPNISGVAGISPPPPQGFASPGARSLVIWPSPGRDP